MDKDELRRRAVEMQRRAIENAKAIWGESWPPVGSVEDFMVRLVIQESSPKGPGA